MIIFLLASIISGCASVHSPDLVPSVHSPEPILADNAKANCIYSKLGAPLQRVEHYTGIVYNCIETFSDSGHTWSDWVSPWIIHNAKYNGWLAADPSKRQIIFTQNIIPANTTSNPNWLADCAAGSYNTYARQFATNLVDTGFGHSVIRLGVEMNGTWNVGSLGTTVAEWHQWGRCFAQEVQAMRGVPTSHLLFDWDVNANYRNIPLADFYPGNSYVDIIGIDAYDDSGISLPPVGNPTRWAILAGEPEGLNAVAAFAAEHGKPLSIPEWGTVTTQGDDGGYVSKMGAFIANNDIAFECWFNTGDDGIFQLNRAHAPLSVAAYIKAFR